MYDICNADLSEDVRWRAICVDHRGIRHTSACFIQLNRLKLRPTTASVRPVNRVLGSSGETYHATPCGQNVC